MTITHLVSLDRREWELVQTLVVELQERIKLHLENPDATLEDRRVYLQASVLLDNVWTKLRNRASDARQMFALNEDEHETYETVLRQATHFAHVDTDRHPLLVAIEQAERIAHAHTHANA